LERRFVCGGLNRHRVVTKVQMYPSPWKPFDGCFALHEKLTSVRACDQISAAESFHRKFSPIQGE